tara:strand:- start:1382 stop:2857 length:1476 start_codon:yes stop_codon:yes gene_type:complete
MALALFNHAKVFLGVALFLSYMLANSWKHQILQVEKRNRNETVISVHHQVHMDYGLAYPMTYEFDIPSENNDQIVSVRYRSEDEWTEMVEKTSNDFFNGIEAVRFDHGINRAYVSVGFSSISDSIFIMFHDEGAPINVTFDKMSAYYDDRDAVVTSTADDWADWCNEKFIRTCRNFRDHNLWLSCAIVTNGASPDTWNDIQIQIDSGYVEAVAHSRTHPYVPYDDIEGEVMGSKQDIIDNLELPIHSRYGENEYVYAWVAPYGEYDDEIDSMVSISKYLTTRLYYAGEHDFSSWNEDLNKFDPIGVSREMGPLWVGTTDTNDLNSTFDEVVSNGGVYHVMCHPNILEWDEEYPWVHMEHISNRKNIWYVGFGYLHAYHFLQSAYPSMELDLEDQDDIVSTSFKLYQNYPNPFNSRTSSKIYIGISDIVNISIYGLKGDIIKNIFKGNIAPGYHSFNWDGTNELGTTVSAGLYFMSIRSDYLVQTKKMMFLK